MGEYPAQDVAAASESARSTLAAGLPKTEPVYHFGSVQVDSRRRSVRADGRTVKIGSRAFDLLVALLQTRGTVVDKRNLMHRVWPHTTVDESNLRFQMTCLRRALGSSCDIIKTIPGRGYFLVADTGSGDDETRRSSTIDFNKSAKIGGESRSAVAIVEDDEGVRDALDGLLRSFGFTVDVYACPEEFLRAGSASVGCLILDVCLPRRSGLEVQTYLNAAGVNVPIIFISGHADVHMSVKAMKAGAFEFLTKPVRHEEVLQAVQEALRVRRQ